MMTINLLLQVADNLLVYGQQKEKEILEAQNKNSNLILPIKQQLLSKKSNNLASSLYKSAFDRTKINYIIRSTPS
jgi:hypothetical protein